MHDMPNRESNRKDQPQQPERPQQERRQQERGPNEERRQQEQRQNIPMAQGGNQMTPDSLPEKEKGNWADENSQSGTSQAQKGQGGHTPKEQGPPGERHERHEQKGEGTSHSSNPSAGNPSSGNPSPGRESSPGRDRGFEPPGSDKKRESGEKGNFGESRDTGFGRGEEAHRGAGGKVDPSQRDMGQTGQRK